MKMLKNKQSGFTLIELLVVLIIVAILAAVGIPLFRGNLAGARTTEADATLGTIRTAVRAAQAAGPFTPPISGTVQPVAGLNFLAGDLTGHYFQDTDYTFAGDPDDTGPRTYCVTVTGNSGAAMTNGAPRRADVAGVVRSMDDQGSIFANATCTGTAII